MTPKRQQVLVTIDSTPDSVAPLTLALVLDAPARRGQPISGRLAAEGGTGGYVYAIIAGSLPSGTSMPDSATGELVGTPGTIGVAEFVARVQDSSSTVVDTSFAIDVGTSLSLPDPPQRTYGEVGLAFRVPLRVLGATGPMSWTIASGNLHNGLTIAPDPLGEVDEAVTGTPITPGGNSRALLVGTDSGSGDTISLLFETTVAEALVATGINQMIAPVGAAVSTVVPIIGGLPPYSVSHYSGQPIPDGLTLIGGRRRSSYVIAGQAHAPPSPDDAGNEDFLMTMRVTDALGASSTFPVRITVIGQPYTLQARQAGVDVGKSAVRIDFDGTAVKSVACADDGTTVTLTPQATATSVLGCAGAAGDAASIQATTDDRVLARVAGALSWTQVTAAMHATSGVTAATYTNATVTVNASGHVTAAASGAAPVTSVGASSPIASSGGTTPMISHATSGIAAGTYDRVTVNATGHATGGVNAGTTIYSRSIAASIAYSHFDFASMTTETDVVRFTGAAGGTSIIRGLYGAPRAGQVVYLVNASTTTLTISNQDGAEATAAARFAIGANFSLAPDHGCTLWYDGTSSRWRVIGAY